MAIAPEIEAGITSPPRMAGQRGTRATNNQTKKRKLDAQETVCRPQFNTILAQGIVWKPSSVKHEDLEKLVDAGLLQPQAIAFWRADPGAIWPFNEHYEIVVFTSFYERGFATPAHDFLRGLLFFYGLELIHLNPNSILLVSIYIHLCEAFLGIDPHFDLWHHLFHVKPDPITFVGGATFQLCQGREQSTSTSST